MATLYKIALARGWAWPQVEDGRGWGGSGKVTAPASSGVSRGPVAHHGPGARGDERAALRAAHGRQELVGDMIATRDGRRQSSCGLRSAAKHLRQRMAWEKRRTAMAAGTPRRCAVAGVDGAPGPAGLRTHGHGGGGPAGAHGHAERVDGSPVSREDRASTGKRSIEFITKTFARDDPARRLRHQSAWRGRCSIHWSRRGRVGTAAGGAARARRRSCRCSRRYSAARNHHQPAETLPGHSIASSKISW